MPRTSPLGVGLRSQTSKTVLRISPIPNVEVSTYVQCEPSTDNIVGCRRVPLPHSPVRSLSHTPRLLLGSRTSPQHRRILVCRSESLCPEFEGRGFGSKSQVR